MRRQHEEFDLEPAVLDPVDAGAHDAPVPAPAPAPGATAGGIDAGPVGMRLLRGPAVWVVAAALLIVSGMALAERPSPWRYGILPTMGEPAQRWTVEHGLEIERREIWETEHAILLHTGAGVTAFDPANGGRLWSQTLSSRCSAPADGEVLCTVGTGSDAELLTLDVTDGTIVREPVPGLLFATAIPGGMVSLHTHDDGAALQRTDSTGAVAWEQLLGGAPGWS